MNSDNPSTDAVVEQPKEKGVIAFFANNSVAANLMMAFIIIMGLFSYFNINL